MKFLDRMALLVKADAHGVMDQLEERSLLVKQHLREAELELTYNHGVSDYDLGDAYGHIALGVDSVSDTATMRLMQEQFVGFWVIHKYESGKCAQ